VNALAHHEAEMAMTPEEMGLLEAISADPLSPVPRLVYADWLDDRGSALAPYVRAECGLISLPPGDRRFPGSLDRLEQIVRSTGMTLGGWEHTPILERLKGKMERRRDRDPNCEKHGSQMHQYRLAPPLAEAELLGLERRLGFLLPSEYRAFVLRVCNGPIGPGYRLEPLVPATAPATLAALQEMLAGKIPEQIDIPEGPPGMLYLAYIGDGHSFLVLTGQQRGTVWTVGDEFTAPDFDFGDCTPHGFFSWYEAWLDS
jgi:uncharacterized protein (TIGR02996 family)